MVGDARADTAPAPGPALAPRIVLAHQGPPPTSRWTATLASPEASKYVQYSDLEIADWLAVKTSAESVVLAVSNSDIFVAHAAVRHAHDLCKSGVDVTLLIPKELLRHKAFTPWFADARVHQPVTVSWLRHEVSETECWVVHLKHKQAAHVHAAGAAHHATFDLRVAGLLSRVLLDTGATCSCVSLSLVQRAGRSYRPLTSENRDISGIGGTAAALGSITLPVKVGKQVWDHDFLVVKDPIAGYMCLLGEDFLAAHDCGLFYAAGKVHLSVACSAKSTGTVVYSRSLSSSNQAELRRDVYLGAVSVPSVVLPLADTQARDSHEPLSHSKRKKLLRLVAAGKAMGYRVVLTPQQCVVAGSQGNSVPDLVQKVLDKHSVPGGTLCGQIPDNTHAKGFECRIELLPGVRPVNLRQYRLTPREKEELLAQCDSFIQKGWIEPSASGWCSSVLFVPKPNNKLRFCVDFRGLNQRTVVDPDNKHVIPRQAELMDSLNGAAVFSTLDLASGYYQLAVESDSRPLTAFPTPYGLYQWRVMPMGLMNAPAVFQRAMNTILREHIKAGYCLVYLDDIIVLSRSLDEHARHLDSVLSALSAHNLFCQLPKCVFAQAELKYLGHVVSGQGVKPDPAKVAALESWEPPVADVAILADPTSDAVMQSAARKRIVHECRRFLGFMNYFNRFIPKYSDQAAVLHDQTRDDAPAWSEACTKSWRSLSTCLREATMMYHPDGDKPFHVFSDASIRAIGGVLMQERDEHLVPVAFCARKLIPAEVNYSTTEQELLAIVYCFAQWRCYLEGPQVVLHTDHEPLTWLANQKLPNRRQARWLEFLSRFSYEILYVKGDKNVVADALSRQLSPGAGAPDVLLGDAWPESVLHVQRGTGSSRGFAPGIHQAVSVCVADLCSAPSSAGVGRSPVAGGSSAACQAAERVGAGPIGSVLSITRFVIAGGYTRASAAGRQVAARGRGDGSTFISAGGVPKRPALYGKHKGTSTVSPPMSAPDKPEKTVNSSGWFASKEAPLTEPNSVHVDGSESCSTSLGVVGAPVKKSYKRALDGSLVESGPDSVSRNLLSNFDESDPPLTLGSGSDGVPTEPSSEIDPSLSAYERLFENLVQRIKRAMLTDADVSSAQKRAGLKLVDRHGLLWRGNQLYVPADTQLRLDILYWHHDVPWCAHLGVVKTLELVKRQFWWPKLDLDIRKYVASCYKCQANKPDRRSQRVPLTPLVSPDACWRVLGVDLVVDLPETSGDGFNAICVFACHLSKMVRIVPTRTTLDSHGFAKLFIREVFPHYGFPRAIVSDRGTQWNSELFRTLCERLNIRLTLSTAYHPQTNGLVERFNEVIAAALRHFVSADQRDWDDKVPFIEFALNASYDASTQSTPFRMNRITLPLNPFEAVVRGPDGQGQLTSPLASWVGSSSAAPTAVGSRTALEAHESLLWARQCVHRAKEIMKEKHDARGTRSHLYAVGQLVWFNQKHVRLRHPTRRLKLQPRFVGPVRVVEMVGRSAVRLELPAHLEVHPTVSVTLVKPFVAREGVQLPPVVVDGELEWEVEAVIGHNLLVSRKRSGATYLEFRVRWKGSYEDSWHEFSDFENSVESVQKYINACVKSVRRQILAALKPGEVSLLNATLQAEALAGKARST